MEREGFITNLKKLSRLLDGVTERTHTYIQENRKVRQLIDLRPTIHNKTRLKNEIEKATHYNKVQEN